MMHSLTGRLIKTTTSDRIRLHGLLVAADGQPAAPVDGIILVHGLGGNFYSSGLLEYLAQTLPRVGVEVLLANTRGHDFLSPALVGGRLTVQGAALEIVDECRLDVAAWVRWAKSHGWQRIALGGHSLGAIKSLYAAAHEPDLGIDQIIAISATRLSHQRLADSSGGDRFRKWIDQAQRLKNADQGQTLMHVDFPFPTYITADAYWDKYGPADRYDWLNFISDLSMPIQLIFGELELQSLPALNGILEQLEQTDYDRKQVVIKVIPGADHFYVSRVVHVSREIRSWWASQLASQS